MGKLTPLLNKTLRPFTLYALIVLGASIPVYYLLVDGIWLRELDEHNRLLADRTQHELDVLKQERPAENEKTSQWHYLQPGTNLKADPIGKLQPDSTYTIRRQNLYVDRKDINRYRGLRRTIRLDGKFYRLTVETNVEETEETVMAIALVTVGFFLLLIVGFLLLNRRLSVELWEPFRQMLAQLKSFNLDHQTPVDFAPSNIREFAELREALNRLIGHSITVYQSQREFIQNASHELQTPLAIAKNKLDVLLQEAITERHYQLIEAADRALMRVTRINKNLLLLSRLEQGQFLHGEPFDFQTLLQQCIELLEEPISAKKIKLQTQLAESTPVTGNRALVEILLNNLLINAIRYTTAGDKILITLQKECLTIANTGKTPLNTAGLFRRFYHVSSEHAGSGLGLAIVRQIVDHHGWQIQYRFEPPHHFFIINLD